MYVTVEQVFTTLDKALKTFNLYMGKGDLAETALDNALESMSTYLAAHERLDFEVAARGLSHGGETFETGKQSSRYYFHLFKDGVRELSFLAGIQREEIRSFINILIDRHHDAGLDLAREESTSEGQWEFRDQDSVTRLWEADLAHVRYHAIDVYAAGELFDPERGTRRSLAELVQEQMRRYRPKKAPRGSVANAAAPTALRSTGWMPVGSAVTATPESLEAMRDEASHDDLIHMDRFAIIWARLVQTAPPDQRPKLSQLMLKTFRAWVDEGNWDAMHRALKVLQALAVLPDHREMVQSIVLTLAQPEELMRLQPAVLDVPPANAPKVVVFFGALGQKSVMTLARMLMDAPPGARLSAFVEGFSGRGLDPISIQLARLRSKEATVVRDAMQHVVERREEELVREPLRLLLTRRDSELRLAALKMLGGDEDPRTLRGLVRGLEDANQKIRSYVIRTLGAMPGSEMAERALMSRVTHKGFRALHPVERNLLLVGAARVGGPKTFAWFRNELERKGFFGAKKLRAWHDELMNALREAGSEGALALIEGGGDAAG